MTLNQVGASISDVPPDAGERSRRDLIDRLARSDMSALGELFETHGNAVFQAARPLLTTRADAEDVTQDVFLRLPAAVQGFTGTAAQFWPWLRQVAVRQALMHLRSRATRREVNVDTIASLFGRTESPLERVSIDMALERLPSELRAVFVLKEVEGYAHGQIAELLGISVANSEVRLHRARKTLRVLLGSAQR